MLILHRSHTVVYSTADFQDLFDSSDLESQCIYTLSSLFPLSWRADRQCCVSLLKCLMQLSEVVLSPTIPPCISAFPGPRQGWASHSCPPHTREATLFSPQSYSTDPPHPRPSSLQLAEHCLMLWVMLLHDGLSDYVARKTSRQGWIYHIFWVDSKPSRSESLSLSRKLNSTVTITTSLPIMLRDAHSTPVHNSRCTQQNNWRWARLHHVTKF